MAPQLIGGVPPCSFCEKKQVGVEGRKARTVISDIPKLLPTVRKKELGETTRGSWHCYWERSDATRLEARWSVPRDWTQSPSRAPHRSPASRATDLHTWKLEAPEARASAVRCPEENVRLNQ